MPTIIIVGASSGIGYNVAERFARLGWRVGVCARRVERLEELAARYPERIFPLKLDINEPDAADCITRFIDTTLGGLDILFHAAGCGWNNPNLEPAKDRLTVMTNTVGFTAIIGSAFRWFEKNNPSGKICAVSSIAGTKGLGVSATYSASKRYENTFLESLAQLTRIKHLKIGIVDIRPGFIDTDLLDTSSHRYPMLMSLDYAAKRIFKAVLRKRHGVVYVDWRWNIVVKLWRLIPRWLWVRLKILN